VTHHPAPVAMAGRVPGPTPRAVGRAGSLAGIRDMSPVPEGRPPTPAQEAAEVSIGTLVETLGRPVLQLVCAPRGTAVPILGPLVGGLDVSVATLCGAVSSCRRNTAAICWC